jgi:hypothetical protein
MIMEVLDMTSKTSESKLFSVKQNWHIFVPYLNDQDVINCLARCLGYPNANKWDQDKNPPWSFTCTDYWVNEIDQKIENDPQYQSELESLFLSLNNCDADIEDDDLWIKVFISDEYRQLRDKYRKKYEPKRGEYEWYQWKHACFYITPFMMKLIQKALPEAHHVRIVTSHSHSVVQFILDDQLYYADLLNEWNTVEELENFMETGDTID